MTPMHPPPPDDDPLPTDEAAPWLSALADGQAWAAPQALRHWRDDAAARRTWHAYQLIGDAMRSDELAQPAARDRALLERVRRRLADEPVVLSPLPAVGPASLPSLPPFAGRAAPRASVLRRLVPVGLAASLVLGAAWLVAPQRGDAPAVAGGGAGAAANGVAATVAVAAALRPDAAVGDDRVLRDPRLEEFLRVHQSARGGVATPGGGLRRVDAWVVSTRPAAP